MSSPSDAIVVQKTSADRWDQSINWGCPSRGLADDLIATSTWSVTGPDSSLTLSDESIDTTKKITTVWLDGGTLGAYYTVTNTITTLDTRVLTGTFIVQIVDYIFLTQPRVI